MENNKEPLRWAALGGLEEIGRNCMFFEYKNEIIVVDLGLQFPEEETPGIDYIIPNVAYLEKKKKNIKALILTHGHYDHIGAIPYLSENLGNPLIYGGCFTKEIVQKRQEEFPKVRKLNFRVIKDKDKIKLSKYFEIEFFEVIHNIPDTFGFILKTPVGKFINFADFKLSADIKNPQKSLERFKNILDQKFHTLFLDSTNAEEPGYSVPKETVRKNLEEIFRESKGRIIIATFASLIDRLSQILEITEKFNRKLIISGYSMETNVKIAQNIKYLKIKDGLLISQKEADRYPENKVVILTTGAQGEPNAGLMKIASREHRSIKVKPGDTVIFSSSIIPGNEKSIQNLKDELTKQGIKIYCLKVLDIHSGGHAPSEELKIIIKNVKSQFLIPYYAYYFMRAKNKELAVGLGFPEKNVFLPMNGQVLHIFKDQIQLSKENLPTSYVMVDGLGVGDVEEVVLRDRKSLAQEGMIVVITTLDRRTNRLLKNPDIISRGFIYLRANKGLLEDIRKKIKDLLARLPSYQPLDSDYFKSLLRDQIGLFIYKKTKRRPVILPVVIQV